MKILLLCFLFIASGVFVFAQKLSMADIKAGLEHSPNSPLYVKQVLKKRFKIDTIVVTRTAVFRSMADSLAYLGKEKKVSDLHGKLLVQPVLYLNGDKYEWTKKE